MQQKRYMTADELVVGATQLSAAAGTHGVSLALLAASKPLIDAEITALTGAIDALRQGRHDLRELRTALGGKHQNGYRLANTIRDVLKPSFGWSYNPMWEGTGLNQSLQVPRSFASLEGTLRSMKSFLTDNPSYELAGVATGALAETAATDLSAARIAVQSKKAAVRGMVTTRIKKEQVIRRRIRMVVEELKSVLGPVDARWEAFGLNQPGLKQAPSAPKKVTVTLLAGGKAEVKWDKSSRAEYYRVWLKVVGVDEDFESVGSPADLDFTIEGLPSGAQVEIAVSASNNGGESARSEVVLVTMP